MKLHLASLLLVLASCSGTQAPPVQLTPSENPIEVIVPAFQAIVDSAEVAGAILIYDLEENIYYSNDFEHSKKGFLPASTFKITNSIIALETGVVQSDSTLFPWDGNDRRLDIWEQDLTFRDAFHFSCVPCYQEVARKIGSARMIAYLDKLDYGEITLDSTDIDLFWLQGDSKISQIQQIDFLKRFYQSQLPISERTESIMKKLMVMEENDSYKISGKTGWSIRNGNNNGWFVGYLESQGKTYFFATNITPDRAFDMNLFPMIRKDITFKAFEQMGLLD